MNFKKKFSEEEKKTNVPAAEPAPKTIDKFTRKSTSTERLTTKKPVATIPPIEIFDDVTREINQDQQKVAKKKEKTESKEKDVIKIEVKSNDVYESCLPSPVDVLPSTTPVLIENTVQDVSLEEVLAEMPTNNEKPEVQNVSALENVEDLQSPSFRSHVEIIQLEPGTSVICDQKKCFGSIAYISKKNV